MIFAVPVTFTAADKLTPFFTKGAASASKFASAVQASFKKSTGSVSMFKQILGGVTLGNLAADGIRSAVSGLKSLAAQGIELASNLTEVQNVVDTSFGADAAQINAWSKTAITQFGLSELQAQQFNGTMGAMLKSSGLAGGKIVEMSTKLTGLTGDFASFYNLPIDVAFQKIRSGISGETEPLKQLGINMSVANMEAFALTQGIRKKWAALSQGEQAQLRYAYLMKVSADAQGDFAKTLATSNANQLRVFETQKAMAAANFMSALLPLQMKFYQTLNTEILPAVNRWIDANKDLIASRIDRFVERATGFVERAIPVVKAAIGFIWDFGPAILAGALAFKTLGATLRTVDTVAKVFGATLNMSPIMIIGSIIAVAIAAFTLLASKVGGIGPAFRVVGQTIAKFFLTPINGAIDAVQALLSLVAKIPGLKNLAGGASAGLEKLQAGMNTTLTGSTSTVWDKGLNAFTDPYNRERVKVLNREAPNAAKVEGDRAAWRGDMYFHNAPEGATVKTEGSGAPSLRLNLMGVND